MALGSPLGTPTAFKSLLFGPPGAAGSDVLANLSRCFVKSLVTIASRNVFWRVRPFRIRLSPQWELDFDQFCVFEKPSHRVAPGAHFGDPDWFRIGAGTPGIGRLRCLQASQGDHGCAIVGFKCASHTPCTQYNSTSGASCKVSMPHLRPPRAPQAWNSIVLHHETHIAQKRLWAAPGCNCGFTTRLQLAVVSEL